MNTRNTFLNLKNNTVINFVFALLFCCLLGATLTAQQQNTVHITPITLDGNLSDWSKKPYTESFVNSWYNNDHDQTVFDYTLTDNYFYFYFNVVDATTKATPFIDETSIPKGDRVEIFFSKSKSLKEEYYCLEVSPNGNILDYTSVHPRKFNPKWNFNTLKTVGRITQKGYIVEGSISIDELRSLGLAGEIYWGIFRADLKFNQKSDWYAKNKVATKNPDFHTPSAFEKTCLIPK